MICKKCGKEISDSECLYCKAEELTEKIKNSPDDAKLYFERALCYAGDDNEKAEADFSKVIELEPDNTEAYFKRGKINMWDGGEGEAIDDFDEVIKREPKNIMAYAYRGFCKSVMGYRSDAILDFIKAIQLDPHNAKIYEELESCEDGTIAGVWENYVKSFPKDTEGRKKEIAVLEEHYYLATDYTIDEKIHAYTRLIDDYSALQDTSILAYTYHRRGNMYYERGNMYYQLNSTENAAEDYKKAIDDYIVALRDGELPIDTEIEARDNLADIYDKLKFDYRVSNLCEEAINRYKNQLEENIPDDLRARLEFEINYYEYKLEFPTITHEEYRNLLDKKMFFKQVRESLKNKNYKSAKKALMDNIDSYSSEPEFKLAMNFTKILMGENEEKEVK